MYGYHILFINPSIGRHLSFFHFFELLSNDAINIHAQVFWGWMYIFSSPGYTPRSRIAASYGNYMINLLRNYQIAFQRSLTILDSQHHILAYICIVHFFFIIAILEGMKWYLWGFDSHYSDDKQCWAFGCMFIDHLYIIFEQTSIQIPCPFF